MNRLNFYNEFLVDGIPQLDFLWNALSKFKMEYESIYYRIRSSDVLRPDIISYKCYGVVDFWWVILLVNGIDNPFTGLKEGDLLIVPSKLDIYNFQKRYRVRRTAWEGIENDFCRKLSNKY